MNLIRHAAAAALTTVFGISSALGQEPPPAPKPKLKDELRMPWKRGDSDFLRQWLVAGPFACGLGADCLSGQGGEAAARPTDGQELKRADGTSVRWHAQKAWSDDVTFGDLPGAGAGDVAYAFAKVPRPKAGPAVLSIGSRDGIRVWLNGKPVLARDGLRSATPDEDRVAVEMNAGENSLLVKAPADEHVLRAGARARRRAGSKGRDRPVARRAPGGRLHARDRRRPGAEGRRSGHDRGGSCRRPGGLHDHGRARREADGRRPRLAGRSVRGALQLAAAHRSPLRDPPALVQGRQPRQGARAGRHGRGRRRLRSPRASPSGCSSTWSRTAWAAS